jgi:hypothetical protein
MSVDPTNSLITFVASTGYAGSVTIYTTSNTWAGTYIITIAGEILAL